MNLRSILSIALVSVPLSPLVAAAQEEVPLEEAAQEEAAQPQPIPEGQILSRSDVVAADLRRIEAMLPRAAEISRIEAELPARETEIVALLSEIDRLNPNKATPRQLEDQRVSWWGLRREFERWAVLTTARFDTLQAERDRLRGERSEWELTRTSINTEELSVDFLRRIDTTLNRVLEVEAEVRKRRNEVGSLGDRIAGNLQNTATSLDRLDELVGTMRSRLIVRNTPPMWRALSEGGVLPTIEEWRQAGRDWVKSLLNYVQLRRGRMLSLVVWFGLLVFSLTHLRRRSSGWPTGDDSFDLARALVGRPFTLALVFTMATYTLVSPFPPGAVVDLLVSLSAIAIARAGTVAFKPDHRVVLYSVAILTVLGRIGSATLGSSTMMRVLLLLIAVSAGIATGRAAWRARVAMANHESWARVAWAITGLATFTFAVAAGANLFGWEALSRILTLGSVESLTSLLGWAIVVASVSALVPAILESEVGSALPGFRRNQEVVRHALMRAVTLVAVLAWIISTSIRFQLGGAVRSSVIRLTSAGFTIGGLALTIGMILAIILIFLVTRWVAKLAGFVIQEEVVPRFDVGSGAGQSMVTLSSYVIYGFGIIIAASALGLTGNQLTVVIGALGVGIGFGLQNIVNNFVSGLILIFGRPIRIGDTVQTAQHFGQVVRIGIRASTIRSFEGAEIIVPNGDLISKEVTNWTRSDDVRRFEVLVGVAYGTDPEAVMEILRRVADKHPLALTNPEPQVHMMNFGDSSLDFRLRCWARMQDWVTVSSDLRVAINREFKQVRIEIPFPQRDLHLKSGLAPVASLDAKPER